MVDADAMRRTLAEVERMGYRVVVFTNETLDHVKDPAKKAARLAKKLAKIEAFARLMGLREMLALVAIANDEFRKPSAKEEREGKHQRGGVGMWAKAEELEPVDTARSFFVGDADGSASSFSDCDRTFASRVGVPFYTPFAFFGRGGEEGLALVRGLSPVPSTVTSSSTSSSTSEEQNPPKRQCGMDAAVTAAEGGEKPWCAFFSLGTDAMKIDAALAGSVLDTSLRDWWLPHPCNLERTGFRLALVEIQGKPAVSPFLSPESRASIRVVTVEPVSDLVSAACVALDNKCRVVGVGCSDRFYGGDVANLGVHRAFDAAAGKRELNEHYRSTYEPTTGFARARVAYEARVRPGSALAEAGVAMVVSVMVASEAETPDRRKALEEAYGTLFRGLESAARGVMPASAAPPSPQPQPPQPDAFPPYNPPALTANTLPRAASSFADSLYVYLDVGTSPLVPANVTRQVFWYDSDFVVVYDAYPKSRRHLLVMPRLSASRARDVYGFSATDLPLVRRLHDVARRVARSVVGGDADAVAQLGYHALPTMRHVHLHVMSRDLDSPWLKKPEHWNSFTHPRLFLSMAHVEAALAAGASLPPPPASLAALQAMVPLPCPACAEAFPTVAAAKEHWGARHCHHA